MTLWLSSSAFSNGEIIPEKYTCDGDRKLSPPLTIHGVPEKSRSLVLIMDDPDIPTAVREAHGIKVFDHWVLFNIPADTKEIPEGAIVGTEGVNTSGANGYTGPCPPPEYEPSEHRYIFKLFALDEILTLQSGATKSEVLEALAQHTLAQAELTGRYSRK